MDRLDELRAFLAIVESKSMADAAQRLRMSPPSMTRALHAIETRTRTRLIERTTRHLSLTDAGRAFADDARKILDGYDALISQGEPEIRGLLRVTAPVVFGAKYVAPLLEKFVELNQNVRVDLVLSNMYLNLFDEKIDIAVRIGHLRDSSLLSFQLGKVNWSVVASPAYLAKHGAPTTPRMLQDHKIIFGDARPGPVEWRFSRCPGNHVVRLTPCFSSNDTNVRLMAAKSGRGIARFLSYQVAEDIKLGALVRLLIPYTPTSMPVRIVATNRRFMPPTAKAFWELAAQELRRNLDGDTETL